MPLTSPFEKVHERMGAAFAEYDGWRLPKDFGEPAAERAALEGGCAAFDLSSFGRISVKGEGAESLIKAISGGETPWDGRWVWSASHDVGRLRIACSRGSYLVLTPPSEKQAILERIRTMSAPAGPDVADMTENTAMLGVYGPESLGAVTRILPFDLSGLELGGVRAMSLLMIHVTILRGSWTEGDGVEIICPAQAAPLAGGAVAKYQQRERIVPAGMDCLMAAMRKA